MALATGFSVANCYYNQSLLGSIVSDFHASEYDGSIISALTQFGYVVGLCIVIPLGNTLSKKRIITIDYFCCSMALLSVAITKDLFIIKLSSFIIGISSVMPQFFIPMAALYSVLFIDWHFRLPISKRNHIGSHFLALRLFLCIRCDAFMPDSNSDNFTRR